MLGLRHFRGCAIDLFQGDITEFVCDAMVNAANSSLGDGGGVAGAIHRVGGPSILAACEAIGSCPTGEARLTTAGQLPCQRVIHTVGPIWKGGQDGEADLLRSAYRESLRLAATHELRHVAFPSISTGAYSYPLDQAAPLALKTVKDFLTAAESGHLRRITFVLFDRAHYQSYQKALFTIFPEEDEERA